MELHYTPPSAWITLGVLLAAGLTLALLNLYFQVSSCDFLNHNISIRILQKWLTIFGSAIYGGAILMVTTDYFLEDSLVLGWVWERVKVKQIQYSVLFFAQPMLNLNACNPGGQNGGRRFGRHGDPATVLDGLGSQCSLASRFPHRCRIVYKSPRVQC